MSNNLEVLADNRKDLLLAEVAAWLHDWRKCTDRHVIKNARGEHANAPEVRLVVPPLEITLLGRPIILQRLIKQKGNHWLELALKACHSAAHTEKEEVFLQFKQTINKTYKITPFGYKSENLEGLDIWLDALSTFMASFNPLIPRTDVEREIKHAFSHACGDTRQPINDVTLWDWSHIAAALYKATVAEALLYGQPNPAPTKWRLFSVRLDGLGFLTRASHLPDLLARQKLIDDGLNKVRSLLEEKYPLGTEIYRDENGSVFIVPNLDIRELENGNGEKLSKLVHDAFGEGTLRNNNFFKLCGEVLPILDVDKEAWEWTNPYETNRSSQQIMDRHNRPLPVGYHVKEEKPLLVDASIVDSWWRDHREDICTVCQLRPQGWGAYDREKHYGHKARGEPCPPTPACQTCKALDRNVCAVCEQRRENNSNEWSRKLSTTIWIDEVADINGRIALVVGNFALDTWFTGDSLFYPQMRRDQMQIRVHRTEPIYGALRVKNLGSRLADGQIIQVEGIEYTYQEKSTLFVTLPFDDPSEFIPPRYSQDLKIEKHFMLPILEPPPAQMVEAQAPTRLFRVWETSKSFWEDAVTDFKTSNSVGEVTCRLQIVATYYPKVANQTLGISHAYELKMGEISLSIACVNRDTYLTIDNLRRAAFLLGASEEEYTDAKKAAEYLQVQLGGKTFDIEEATGYGSSNKALGKLKVTTVESENTSYLPAISILKEPRTFMALVPADKALQVAKAIKKKYEDEIGKVRNRLPLTLGVVVAGARTPLPAILDAGRRMLKQPTETTSWQVKEVDLRLYPEKVLLTLGPVEGGEPSLTLDIPTIMGDKETEDVWYPYWCLGEETANASERKRKFKGIDGKYWTHVSDLQIGDVVSFMPSRFDFEYLDTAARRFEISYENGKRRGAQQPGSSYHPARPYYLEQLDGFDQLWKILSQGLETTQIHNLIGIIEDKRMTWGTDPNNETFKQTVHDALNNANWKPHLKPEQFDQLYKAALSGQLTDIVELYMQIES